MPEGQTGIIDNPDQQHERPDSQTPRRERKSHSLLNRLQAPFRKERQEKELTEQEKVLKNFFFQSFRFAQGDGVILHDKLFAWAKAKGHLEGLDIPRSAPDYILNIQVPTQHKKPSFLDNLFNDKKGLLKKKWSTLHHMSKQQVVLNDNTLQSIADEMIKKDIDYQIEKRKRPPYDGVPKPDSIHDVHASFVRKYGLNQSNTGSPIYDQLFSELRPYFATASKLPNLKKAWEENHPDPDNPGMNIPFLTELLVEEPVTAS